MDLTFGVWLKRRRRLLDLTQDDLAKRAFCSINSIRKIESGDLAPSKALALEIARALELPAPAHAEFVRFARTPEATAPENAFSEPPPSPAPRAATASSAEPRTPQTVKFQPPAPLTAVVGREHDTSVVCNILRLPSARLVTLTGPPGTGKTRLALEVAAELQGEFENGAAFVALAPVSQSALVETAMAQALDLRESAQMSLSTALRSFLRDKQLLLVLDNFEHVLAAAPLVSELLMNARHLKILATSREHLRVYGERELPLAPLAVPPLTPLPPWRELETFAAVQLFIERAQAVKPNFELTETNAEAIARLCAGLDGLPLAIEMAAARVKWDSPQALFAQWNQRLALLASGLRERETRQQTLRGAMDWSYDLLDETEQRVFRHLGVFRGGFTADAAQAVCGSPVQAVLENLVEKSLVKLEPVADGSPRYALLETIREYALARLAAAGELEHARAQHAAFVHRLAHSIWHTREFGAQGTWHRFDIRDAENFRAAMDWWAEHDAVGGVELASDLSDFWSDLGLTSEGRAWLHRLLPQSAASPVYARGLNIAAVLAVVQGDNDEATQLAEQARRIATTQQLDAELGQSLQTLSRIAIFRAEYERAESLLLKARPLFQALGLRPQEASVLNNLGLIAKDRGELARAQAYHQAALDLRRALGSRAGIAQSLLNLCIVAYWSGDYARAIQVGYESYELCRADGDIWGTSYALETIAMAQFKQKHFGEALQSLQECFRLLEEIGDKRGLAMVLNDIGDVARVQGQLERAIQCYHDALRLCLQTGEKRRSAFCLEALAAVTCLAGSCLRAATLLGAADALRQAIGAPLYAAERADYEAIVNQVRERSSDYEFASAWKKGQAFTLEGAIAFALA